MITQVLTELKDLQRLESMTLKADNNHRITVVCGESKARSDDNPDVDEVFVAVYEEL